jgi:GNAT superfamily N-acetyltransferase
MSSVTTNRVTLRPAETHDRDFLVSVYGASREEELAQVAWPPGAREAFVEMQFDAQDASYRAGNPRGSFDVIEVAGEPAGRLYVDRRLEEIRVVDIALLPRFRGLGVGAFLISQLQDEAAASGRYLSIHVEIHNRAAEFYSRMGFVPTGEAGLYRRMEWSAR